MRSPWFGFSVKLSTLAFLGGAAALVACTPITTTPGASASNPDEVPASNPDEVPASNPDEIVPHSNPDAGVPTPPTNSCETNHGGCDTHATCTPTGDGTNSCACDEHYTGDGATCAPVDSCQTANGGCDVNGVCTSTGPGTNTCACPQGYDGDGTTCTSIDPCQTANGGCDANATCTHTGPGTSSCECNQGYTGDGTTCTVAFALNQTFPTQGYDLSNSGGYVILLAFNQPYVLTGNGTATLEDVTASTSVTLPSGSFQNWGSPNNLALHVDNGATHNPAHTYRVTVSSDLVQGFGGITWTYLR